MTDYEGKYCLWRLVALFALGFIAGSLLRTVIL